MKLWLYPNPVLRGRSEPVGVVTSETVALAVAMAAFMREYRGVGLAAPQIGISKRIIIVGSHNPEQFDILIDPVIVQKSEDKEAIVEGCLSLPGIEASLKRPKFVVVEATDGNGERKQYEFDGLRSAIVQHEIDHLEGLLFVDKLSPTQKILVAKGLKELERDYYNG